MIPRIIHFCWFGNGKKNELILKCIRSWKKYCPDFVIKEWNEDNFDVKANKFCYEAYKNKKWAFVSDYARMWILYHYGGVYFDTDIELLKPIDPLMHEKNFTGFESELKGEWFLQTGVIGCESKNPLILEMLKTYDERSLFNENGEIYLVPNVIEFTNIFKKHGMENSNSIQRIESWTIYPQTYFTPIDPHGIRNLTKNSYTDHHFMSSWETPEKQGLVQKRRSLKFRARKKLNLIIKKVVGKRVVEYVRKTRGGKDNRN